MIEIKECTIFDLRVTQLCQERGIPRFIRNLIMQISKSYSGSNFYFMLNQKWPKPSSYELLKSFGQFFFPEEGNTLFKKKRIHNYFISLFPIPNNNPFEFLFPNFLYGHAPYILGMIWDLIPLVFPKHYLTSWQDMKTHIPAYVAMCKADHLFSISEYTKKDAKRLLNIEESKITNIYGGISPEFFELINMTREEEKQIYSFGTCYKQKYYVYIAANDWRKNLPRTLHAYSLLSKINGEVPYPLVIICYLAKETIKHLQKLISELGLKTKDILFSGKVSDVDLVRLLKNAKGSIFPSLYEGLGLPILESYACGTPVIASNVSSMPEIVHPQCLFDPYNSQEIAIKIHEFSNDSNLRELSLEFGNKILSQLTWKNASDIVAQHLMSSSRMATFSSL